MKPDTYRHLNNDTPVKIKTPGFEVSIVGDEAMDAIVRGIKESNYGLHRFLSSYIRQFKDERYEEEAIKFMTEFIDGGGF